MKPTVSVCFITYNHERFVAQALEGVLMQKTNFDYEIVIGEDCSTDRTREIIKDFIKKYPEKIRLLLRPQNIGAARNFVQTFSTCKGRYIALLDGDDYWTSPYKLQKQVDFLESHPECSECFHDVQVVSEEDKPLFISSPRRKKPRYTLKDLLKGNFIYTCSVVYRKGLMKEFPEWIYKVSIGDWPLHILNAQYGDIGYIDEVMGAYRVHSGGIHSSKEEMEQVKETIEVYSYINAHLNYRYNTYIKTQMWFKLVEKKIGLFLASHGLGKIVDLYRKIFYE
jgi:glycosyltransferase involved in cell wall biosynthesis